MKILAQRPTHISAVATVLLITKTFTVKYYDRRLLGGSGGVVNSLDFCPASLKSLGCFTSGAYFLHNGRR